MTPPGATRCTTCQRGKDAERNAARPWYSDPAYRAAQRGLAQDPLTRCYLCGGYATVDDPMTLDHVDPASIHGGSGPWLPAHRSGNLAKSSSPLPPGFVPYSFPDWCRPSA